uniref:RNA polymerase, sigma-24 subunit, ECF subfamily n=1 Tax=Rhodopseudomonas palustris (strain BisA53) TaxID=316055 RepID=Q07SK4_RHOP5
MSPQIAPEFVDRIMALRPALLRNAAFLVGQRALGSPEDYVQDTLVTALSCADRYEDTNLSGWLTTILHGHIRNASRRAHVRTSVPLSPTGTVDGDAEVIEVPIAAVQEQKLDLADAMEALGTLSAVDQEIILLARIEELSLEEIAARLGVQLGTLYTRLSRATTRLRAAYDADPAAAHMSVCVPRRHAA